MSTEPLNGFEVAIIGMAGRFPGAAGIGEFWKNLENGVESISFFSDDEMEISAASGDRKHPEFVRAKGVVEGIEFFDADFFNVPAGEAEWMDPQQRVFLECAWSALEDAGYALSEYQGQICVYAGVNTNTYLLARLPQLNMSSPADLFHLLLSNEKDHLATRVSYKMNLRGESVTVQTACSTSLVAVHLACQSLIGGQSDMALAGGVSINVPQKVGYLYQTGMVSSPDGHCRAFDHRAGGTVPGHGVGVVALKLLSDAVRDRDHIYAVIRGSAINNDGHLKMGYTAPSAEGQADAIRKALSIAGVRADSISFVEAHGTGTPLGDPIEIEALTRVFREHTSRRGFCALGALKTNIGHLDTAAGVAGLMKAALSLQRKKIVSTLHFEKPNPALNLEESPFYVPTTLREWARGPLPRRAGVSSFGIGGTNAHVVLEEAPELETADCPRPWQLITLSAKTADALERMTVDLVRSLGENSPDSLADMAFTRNVGRQEFAFRRFAVARHRGEAAACLAASSIGQAGEGARVAFMFAGQSVASVDPGAASKELYETEPEFRGAVDECAALLLPRLGFDLCRVLYPAGKEVQGAERGHAPPEFSLPALFTIEYALAMLLMSCGLRPDAMIGHGLGEYVAACLAGVLSVGDALMVVSTRRTDAFHSAPIDAILPDFADVMGRVALKPPRIPYISCLTGSWIKAEQVTDPAYWAAQMRDPVRFAEGLETLRAARYRILIDVGTDRALSLAAGKHFAGDAAGPAISSPRHPQFDGLRLPGLLQTLGEAWAQGARIDWQGLYRNEKRRRVSLPVYPFERRRCWVDAHVGPAQVLQEAPGTDHGADAAVHIAAPQPVLPRGDFVRPVSEVEEKLLTIWREVFGTAEIGVRDDFFELNGDSLLATQIYSRIRQAFDSDISLREILTLQTVAEQAAAIYGNISESVKAGETITRIDRGGPLPASFAQQRLWYIDQLGGSVHYNMPGAMRVRGRLSEDIAERALMRIVERHESLRTVFFRGEDGPMQRILDRCDFRLTRIDLSALTGEAQQAAMIVAVDADAVKPFDLGADLMLRASFMRLSQDDGVLAFNMHHIASDGWSMDILVREFTELYEAFSESRPDRLTPLTIQYKDYAMWQRGWMRGEILERQLSYWERQLADLPQVHGLPLDRPRPSVKTTNGAVHGVEIEPAVLEGLKQLAANCQATLFMALHAVFALLLSRHSNSADIVMGTPVANRLQKELEPLVGFFVNTLVLRADCSAGRSFRDYLAHIRGVHLDAQACQDVPFDHLVERLKPSRGAGHDPLFQIMFISTKATMELRFGGLIMTPMTSDHIEVKSEITLDALERPDGMRMRFAYNRDLFDPSTIRRMGEHLKNLLQGVTLEPDKKIEALPLLTEAEQEHLVYGMNGMPLSENASDAPESHIAPATPMEIALAQVWADVLGQDSKTIGADANFFALGGHSAAAMRLMTRILSEFGVDLSLRAILEAATLSDLARSVTRAEKSLIRPRHFDTTGAAERNKLPATLRLTGKLNREALQRALDRLAERSEILRTTVFTNQEVAPPAAQIPGPARISVIDLSRLPAPEQEVKVRGLAEAEANRPLDEARDRRLRVKLVRLSESEHMVLVSRSYMVSEEWVPEILAQELGSLYAAHRLE